MSSFDALNIERLARSVNEMAIHNCHWRALAFLRVRAQANEFISR
jgi:hypothetical protein